MQLDSTSQLSQPPTGLLLPTTDPPQRHDCGAPHNLHPLSLPCACPNWQHCQQHQYPILEPLSGHTDVAAACAPALESHFFALTSPVRRVQDAVWAIWCCHSEEPHPLASGLHCPIGPCQQIHASAATVLDALTRALMTGVLFCGAARRPHGVSRLHAGQARHRSRSRR
jgi:hypothetical protein